MDFDAIRPIISGVLGAAIAGWLATKWAGKLPHAKDPREQRNLVRRHRSMIRCANIGAAIGIVTGLVLYFGGILDSRDWRGIGLSAGLMAFLPLLVVVAANAAKGPQEIKAGLNAYAISQKAPPALLFPLMALMLVGGIWAAIAFLPKTTRAEPGAAEQPATAGELK